MRKSRASQQYQVGMSYLIKEGGQLFNKVDFAGDLQSCGLLSIQYNYELVSIFISITKHVVHSSCHLYAHIRSTLDTLAVCHNNYTSLMLLVTPCTLQNCKSQCCEPYKIQ